MKFHIIWTSIDHPNLDRKTLNLNPNCLPTFGRPQHAVRSTEWSSILFCVSLSSFGRPCSAFRATVWT